MPSKSVKEESCKTSPREVLQLTYVPSVGTVTGYRTTHPPKNKKRSMGIDQEGCILDLKPAPDDESVGNRTGKGTSGMDKFGRRKCRCYNTHSSNCICTVPDEL
jgi:hypothetical protein